MWPGGPAATSGPNTGTRDEPRKSRNEFCTYSSKFKRADNRPTSKPYGFRLPTVRGEPRNAPILKVFMFYGTIKKFDVADGEGVRVSLFVSGCRNCCAGCFQPQTWDFNFGNEFTEETQNEIIKALEPPHIQGFSLLGGEPFEPENQQVLAPFLKKLKEIYPKKDIWCWTGYIFEKDLQPGGKRYIPEYTELMLNCIDVLVDGPFIQEKKNLMLRFRGSENQRLLHLKDGEIQKIE